MALDQLYDEKRARETTIFNVKEKPSDYNNKNQKRKTKSLKRIPLDKLMDLKVDYAFKQLFGNEKNKDITVVFLNAILQKTGRDRVRDISFTNTELAREYADDKESRLDLMVFTDSDEWINVEMQFGNKYYMIKRSVFYWSKAYQAPLGKGMSYKELRPVIAINILNFDLFKQTERFHTSYHLYEDDKQFKMTDIMEYHFIEMGKLVQAWKEDKLDPWNSVLARWLLLLGIVDHRNSRIYADIYAELEGIAMNDETLNTAFQNWEELSMTLEQKLAYESRLKRILDEESFQRDMDLLAQKLQRQQEAVERSKEQLEKGNDELEKGKDELEKNKEELEKSKDELEKSKDELEKSKDELEKDKDELEKNKEELEKDKEGLERDQKKVELGKEEVELEKEEIRQRKESIDQNENYLEQQITEMVRRLLASDLDINFISEITGLTKERVIELKREMGE
ncbi:Rpn family recombination-promoting nuclease/putative transposase [Virgibacillus sp. NKC19-3]|uniref:Rpn family recombination-promoting nuclease/putative transposase n=1 Tax=Virgibacillus saliphilus TaxID=2831674 RepID=UPI001C9AF816|nr:Rpn family recombination-promoting nuclease/putative transposase [Virgibacillus sp. NKC19-3]MBY7142287.1 Rpn family recombination-promoting nuclease/putative transposase [Virgibacillus sp. NKC19-3]